MYFKLLAYISYVGNLDFRIALQVYLQPGVSTIELLFEAVLRAAKGKPS
jgi:hypothetical protein